MPQHKPRVNSELLDPDDMSPKEQEEAQKVKQTWEDKERERLRGALIPDEEVRLRGRDGRVTPMVFQLRPGEAEHLEGGPKQKPHVKFTDELKVRFIELLSVYGVKYKCARAVGIAPMTFNDHMNKDPEFAELVDQAMEHFRGSLEETIIDRAVHGWIEPVVSAGVIVGYVKKFDNRLLELLLKRHIADFRDKQQMDVNVSGGVLVAPQTPTSVEDWQKQHTPGLPEAQPDGIVSPEEVPKDAVRVDNTAS